MKREMSYRDKMILLIIAVIVIIAGGFFAMIRPKYIAYTEHKAVYDEVKKKWDGIDQQLKAIDPLKESIKKTRDEAASIIAVFDNDAMAVVNKNYEPRTVYYQLDQYFQQAADESALDIMNLTLDEVGTEAVSYYYYTPNAITYSLLETGDLNGAYAAEMYELMEESIVLGAVQSVDLACENMEIVVRGQKEGLMNFLDVIENNPETIIVRKVDIPDYSFTETRDGETPQPGEIVPAPGTGWTEMTVSISLYTAKGIDDPVYK